MVEKIMEGLMGRVFFADSLASGIFFLALSVIVGLVLLPVWLFEYYFLGAKA